MEGPAAIGRGQLGDALEGEFRVRHDGSSGRGWTSGRATQPWELRRRQRAGGYIAAGAEIVKVAPRSRTCRVERAPPAQSGSGGRFRKGGEAPSESSGSVSG
jgi:hypothetical protein